jgi:hypothetical protein
VLAPEANPLELDHGSESLDGAFSGSLEQLGGHEEVRRAAEEMCRVLKPGGVASISTELRIEGPSPGKPGCLMFDAGELRLLIEDGLPWLAASPLDPSVSAATRATEQPDEVLLEPRRYPVIALRRDGHLFTRVHLALVKHA